MLHVKIYCGSINYVDIVDFSNFGKLIAYRQNHSYIFLVLDSLDHHPLCSETIINMIIDPG